MAYTVRCSARGEGSRGVPGGDDRTRRGTADAAHGDHADRERGGCCRWCTDRGSTQTIVRHTNQNQTICGVLLGVGDWRDCPDVFARD